VVRNYRVTGFEAPHWWNYLHSFEIDGVEFSIKAGDFRQWFYKDDRVSFEWEWLSSSTSDRKWRAVDRHTVKTWDKSGKLVVRGLPLFGP
jgi:hypothetical protein